MEEKEIYNNTHMSVYELKDLLEKYPLNILYDYFELPLNRKIHYIFFDEIKTVSKINNLDTKSLVFYLKDNQNFCYNLYSCD